MFADEIRFRRFAVAVSGFGLLMFFAPAARAAAPAVQSIKITPSAPQPMWPPLMLGAKDITAAWEVTFSAPVSGVGANSFRLFARNIDANLGIASVTGADAVYVVTVKVPVGSIALDRAAELRLDFADDDTVLAVAGGGPVGGSGLGNGNFSGETYALASTVCGRPVSDGAIVWCDDFERAVQGANKADLVGNGWTASTEGLCGSHQPARRAQPDAGGCAGIDGDIKPWHADDGSRERAHTGRTMFNRWQKHSVTSPPVNLFRFNSVISRDAVTLSYWLRRGDDSFASAPRGRNSHLLVEYLNRYGKWITLAYYRSAATNGQPGETVRPTILLPDDARWSGFRVRFTQQDGRGVADRSDANQVNGYDYWFIDDVVVSHAAKGRYKSAYCDTFEIPEVSRKFWSFSSEDFASGAGSGERIGDGGITGDVYPQHGSAKHSLFLRWSYIVASSPSIDTSGVAGAISYVVQRGMKNAPSRINGAPVITSCDQTMAEPGNRFVSEYWGKDNTWHTLQDIDGVSGASACGENWRFTSPLLSTLPHSQHMNFRLRFRQISAGAFQNNASDYYDYWLVDDVCIGANGQLPSADLALTKTQEGPFRAGEPATYLLKVENIGPAHVLGYIEVVDVLPPELRFLSYSGTGWDCQSEGQRVTCGRVDLLFRGNHAPDLRFHVMLSDKAKNVVTNTASVSTSAASESALWNNTATSRTQPESSNFAFTKGPCQDGQKVEAASSRDACSYYPFDGLAGEWKQGIHITQMDRDGKLAQAAPSGLGATLEFALRCVDPPGPPAQDAVYAAFGDAVPKRLNICAREGETTLNWNAAAPLAVTIPAGETSAGAFGFFYEDVGRLELFVRVAGEKDKKSSSGEFVQKPAALALENVSCADGTVNPAPAAANGGRFCKAGQAFAMTVASRSVDGNSTPNFGNEKTAKAVFLEKTVLLPANGDDPDLAVPGFEHFTTGRASTAAQRWPEVGIIAVRPRLGDKNTGKFTLSDDYLGAGDIPAAKPVNIGRFYPGHFQTDIGPAGRMDCPPGLICPSGGFFYAGQPFALTVKACAYNDNTCGARLENYRDAFAPRIALSAWAARGSRAGEDENPPDAATNGGYLDPLPGQGLSGAAIPEGGFIGPDGGGGLFTAFFRYWHSRLSRPVGQANIYIRATESGRDGVTSWLSAAPGNSPEAGIAVARGRIKLANRFGTEKAALEIPVQVQFWHCDGIHCAWTLSTTDTTRIGPNTPLADPAKRAALSVSLHAVPGGAPMTSPPRVERFELLGGRGKIVLEPGGETGSVGVSINLGAGAEDNACDHATGYKEGAASNIPWLRAWNGVCTQARSGVVDPAARASLGIYSGESNRAVHNREVY
ncbi:MAG: DUF11 domain-containing protein [Azoarcus sp.]|jgi:uncharacterized repeat protein (TIGR01451 family)|nr:DUF11 domain-containing protein [Azoarcus sp.]